MSDERKGKRENEPDANEYRELLSRLPGIFAANIRRDESGALCEIHILADSERNPKQISRDVQSAVYAAYGVTVDHRIISIAQMSLNPLEEEPKAAVVPDVEPRLIYKGFESRAEANKFSVRVLLSQNGAEYGGSAQCKDTAVQRMRAVVNATLAAAHTFLGGEYFGLNAVQAVQVCGMQVVVTILELLDGEGDQLLVGAAQHRGEEIPAVVRSTLDALNRCLGKRLSGKP